VAGDEEKHKELFNMIDNKHSVGEVKLNSVIQGDCLEVMKLLADKSIDMVLCDLPYG
jgi:DNA modification methylase